MDDADLRLFWPLLQALTGVGELVARRTTAHGQDAATMKLLGLLASGDHLRPTEVAQRLGLSPAAVTRRVRALSQANEVAIRVDPADSRSYTLSLTETGHKRLMAFATDLTARLAHGLPDWDQSRIQHFTGLLNEFLQAAGSPETELLTGGSKPWWRQP